MVDMQLAGIANKILENSNYDVKYRISKLEGKRVDTGAEKDDIRTGKISGDRRAPSGKRNRNIAGNQSL